MKRVFISVQIPDEIKRRILTIQKEIDSLGLIKGRFTEPDNFHLTLKFLGELSDTEIRAIKERLQRIEFDPFYLNLEDLGVFSEQFIRIVWLGVKGGKVFDLQKNVDRIIRDLFPSENRFMGHITIARPKSVEQRKMFLDELRKIKLPKMKFKVDKIYLRESKLSTEGAEYKSILEVPCVTRKQTVSA